MSSITEPTEFGSAVKAWLTEPEHADIWLNTGYGYWSNRFHTTGIKWDDLTVIEVLRTGVNLTTDPKPTVCAVCARPDVSLSQTISGRWGCASCGTWWEYPGNTPASTDGIKAEALREAATAARADAANSRTPQGHAEATTYADWLDDRATEIDPARLEGAHP